MTDRIKLLPDVLANQIAAGEVVQRPASVVKELMENAIDAGADSISLILKDGGKLLITVTDNGMGMSPMDARMSFERHATSKLASVSDLFAIQTMGFRGEALASIAAVAQVEMITKRAEDEVANKIIIEGNKIISQEAVQAPIGTSIAIKNLFFNIPARRTFLKSNDVEKKHAYEEFNRLALSHPHIKFQLVHNDELIHHLEIATLKSRVVSVFKNDLSKRLLPVEEITDKLKISGLVGTPEQARKTRGDQYLFVNNRFIKSALLNHAIVSAFDKIISSDSFPFYVIFLQIDPSSIDVNVHPTKQEIKFEDEHLIYNYLKSAVKHTLSFNLVAPAIDFEKDQHLASAWNNTQRSPHVPLHDSPSRPKENYRISGDFYKENAGRWKDLYENISIDTNPSQPSSQALIFNSSINETETQSNPYKDEFSDRTYIQLHKSYIIFQVKSGLMIIDQQHAHQRILFERYYSRTNEATVFTQTDLFPTTLNLDVLKADILKTILNKLINVGFDIELVGQHSFTIHGYPSFLEEGVNLEHWFDEIIETVQNEIEPDIDFHHVMAMTYADNYAIKRGSELKNREMQDLVDQLFACKDPAFDHKGQRCFGIYSINEIENFLKFK